MTPVFTKTSVLIKDYFVHRLFFWSMRCDKERPRVTEARVIVAENLEGKAMNFPVAALVVLLTTQ